MNVKNAYHYSEAEITIDNVIIKSDPSFYYLGKTSKYVFFYDAKNKSSVIYPSEKINKVVIKTKNPRDCLPVLP